MSTKQRQSHKIPHDKYYTPSHIAEEVVQLTNEFIKQQYNITEDRIEYLEPSAGGGVFLDFLPPYPQTLAYDIIPEDPQNRVEEQDFLKLWLPPVEMSPTNALIRVCIGNPPFGDARNRLLDKFFNQASGLCEVIVWILPIQYLNNKKKFSSYDLVYSEDIGKHLYSGRPVHCCVNIYIRPDGGERKEAFNYNSNRIKGMTVRNMIKKVKDNNNRLSFRDNDKLWYSENKENIDHMMCAWGTVGKPTTDINKYNNSLCFIIEDTHPLKEEVITFIKEFDWHTNTLGTTASKVLSAYNAREVLLKHFPQLETY